MYLFFRPSTWCSIFDAPLQLKIFGDPCTTVIYSTVSNMIVGLGLNIAIIPYIVYCMDFFDFVFNIITITWFISYRSVEF